MYKNFYHFKHNPFNITSDPDFFFASHRHQEALNHLIYGIDQRKGILLITGEIGTGKTTLCRMLINRLDENTKTALILNPDFSDLQLLQLILRDLGIAGPHKNKFDLITALNAFLLDQASHGNNVVLIVDEAQNLNVKQLEQIRLLSNLETEKEKLLQIILVGQPELIDKLKLNALRQLNQRIVVRYHILPFDRPELKGYIYHRLRVASEDHTRSRVLFLDSAIDLIYENSKGTPRLVNILCDRALLAGFIAETFTIDEHIIHRCVQEVVCK